MFSAKYYIFAGILFCFLSSNQVEEGEKNVNRNERTHSMLNICITIPGLSLTFNIAYEL